eukprot:9192988-Pyramimonas_sp.AAC.1
MPAVGCRNNNHNNNNREIITGMRSAGRRRVPVGLPLPSKGGRPGGRVGQAQTSTGLRRRLNDTQRVLR